MTVIVSALARCGSECFSSRPFLKNRRSRKRSVFVLRFSSAIFVRKYSQERMAKNMAPVQSCAMAMFSTEDFIVWSLRMTQRGSAFCCLMLPSLFL